MFNLHKFYRKKNIFYLILKYKNLYDLEKDYDYILKKISKIETIYRENKINVIELFDRNIIVDSIIDKLNKTNKIKDISYRKLIIIFCTLLKIINIMKPEVLKKKNKIKLKIETF